MHSVKSMLLGLVLSAGLAGGAAAMQATAEMKGPDGSALWVNLATATRSDR